MIAEPQGAVRRRVLVVTELFPPETSATAKFMDGIARAIAVDHDVHVLSGQPLYDLRGQSAPEFEQRGPVSVERIGSTRFDRHRLALRLVNALTLTANLARRLVRRAGEADAILVVTNPPFLPLLALWVARRRKVPCIVLVHDLYPHVLFVAGLLRKGSLPSRIVLRLFSAAYRRADMMVALGRDMESLLVRDFGVPAERVVVIPNWGDDEVRADNAGRSAMRQRLGVGERFVVQLMGNMGRTHGVDTVLDAAAALRGDDGIRFLFVGAGAQLNAVRREMEERAIGNVLLEPPAPQRDLPAMLAAADLGIIAFRPGMAGVSVPSRMYNCLAAGQPLVTVADEGAEPALVVEELGSGVAVPAGDARALASAIRHLSGSRDELAEMRRRARAGFDESYSYARVAERWRAAVARVLRGRPAP